MGRTFCYSPAMTLLPKDWFAEDALTLAPKLLGKVARRGSCTGIIVETEAYMNDAASHASKFSLRGAPMRETYGHWYVYFTYGMHWCANVTAGKDTAGGVLIRAVEPIEGIPVMKRRRGTDNVRKLCRGPACFAQAFGITGKDNRAPLSRDFGIFEVPAREKATLYGSVSDFEVVASPRIGIRQAMDLPWRFSIKDNLFVSR